MMYHPARLHTAPFPLTLVGIALLLLAASVLLSLVHPSAQLATSVEGAALRNLLY